MYTHKRALDLPGASITLGPGCSPVPRSSTTTSKPSAASWGSVTGSPTFSQDRAAADFERGSRNSHAIPFTNAEHHGVSSGASIEKLQSDSHH